jgi:hypothetical protein
MAMTKDQILRKLIQRYPSESTKVLNEVSYNLALASVDESTLETRAAKALDRLRGANHPQHPHSPLTVEAMKNQKQSLSSCPICKHTMKTVKLLEDRNAFYCGDHRIVVPFPVVEEDEADL